MSESDVPMSISKPRKLTRRRIWNEALDLTLLENIASKQQDLYSKFQVQIFEDIAKESFPKFTANQCRNRMYSMHLAYRSYLKDDSQPLRQRCTMKVIDKLNEMWPYGPPRMHEIQDEIISDADDIGNTQGLAADGRRIWNEYYDGILLEELIRKRVGVTYHIKQAIFEEIIQESLPGLTVDQCRNRWHTLKKLYNAKSSKTVWPKSVHDKLSVLIDERSTIEVGKQRPEKVSRIWNEENDLRLLKGIMVYHPDLSTTIKYNVWNQIATEVMPHNFTAHNCKNRHNKLRVEYLESKAHNSHSPRITEKVFAKLCDLYEGQRKVRESEICRCCGQINDYLIDLEDEADMMQWFLTFTGLAVEQLVRPYTKICQICGGKLRQAQKFRELCLMGEQIIQTELTNTPPVPVEPEETVKAEKIIFKEEDEPQSAKKNRPKCCVVCSDMVEASEYQRHMREHNAQRLKEDRTCKFCQKTFADLGRLRKHADYHIDGKIHECPQCSKKFTCKGDLRKHIRWHKGTQVGHLCTICGKIFDQLGDLKWHMDTHNGSKPYKCPKCPKIFARVHGLNAHVRSRHENIRYQCGFCDLKYAQSGKLKLHTVLVHQGAILRCNCCYLESTTLKSFRYHLKNVHNTAFNQSIHVILGNGEKLVRRRRMVDSLIQTEKIDLSAEEQHTVEENFEDEEIEVEEILL